MSWTNYHDPVKAVIFDWAGTTVDYGCCAPAVVFVEVFRREGVDITMAEAREPMGTHKKVHIQMITEIPSVREKWVAVKGSEPEETDIGRMYDEFIPLQLECIADYADLIPGTVEAVDDLRGRGIKIGGCTGYSRDMMDVLEPEAKKRGYAPDVSISASDVPEGRPAPWMCLQNAQELNAWPLVSCVKVDDTTPGIVAGLNAGMWTVGFTQTGNELGMTEAELAAMDANDAAALLVDAQRKMEEAGAHYVVRGIWDLPDVIDDINTRLSKGERP